jgi:hypothetical protein
LDRLWLAHYFPEAFAFDRRRGPSLQDVCATLDLDMDVVPLLVPHDCQDGFGGAYWRRPGAYLDPTVRAGISMLAQTEHEREDGLERLQRDVRDGTWAARHHALLDQAELDCGYRIVVGLTAAALSMGEHGRGRDEGSGRDRRLLNVPNMPERGAGVIGSSRQRP